MAISKAFLEVRIAFHHDFRWQRFFGNEDYRLGEGKIGLTFLYFVLALIYIMVYSYCWGVLTAYTGMEGIWVMFAIVFIITFIWSCYIFIKEDY